MLTSDLDLPYFVWTEVLSYSKGWRLLELRLVCKLWNTSIKPISGHNLRYNIIEGNRAARDRFIEIYGKHALYLEIKSLRSETKNLLDLASIQHLIYNCYRVKYLKFQIQQNAEQIPFILTLLNGFPGIKHLSLTGSVTVKVLEEIRPVVQNLESLEIGYVNADGINYLELVNALDYPSLKTLSLSGWPHSPDLVNGVQEKVPQLSLFIFSPAKNILGLEFLMFDMKKHRVKKIKGATESTIKNVGVVFEEVDRPLFPSIDGKNPSVYFQSLFFFGIWQNSNPLVDLDLYIPHVNLIDLKIENVGSLLTLLSSFKRAETIIIEIATPSKSFKLPDCSFNTASLSIDFGKIIPVNYLKWIGAHFHNLKELYIYSKYHEFEIATHLPLSKLERFHTSITQDYGFWTEFIEITPHLKTIYLPEHDYDRVDLINDFPNIVFGYWQSHPGKKFN